MFILLMGLIAGISLVVGGIGIMNIMLATVTEGAAGWLERCRRAHADAALERTRRGERVRGALVGMRAIDELRRAIARRRDAVRIDGRE